MYRSFLFVAATSFFAACIGSALADVNDQQCHAAKEPAASATTPLQRIGGTWRLEQMYEEDELSDDIDILGPDPQGQFIATESGQFSLLLFSAAGRRMSPRTNAGAEPSGLTEAIAYFGTYTLQNCLLNLQISHCLFRGCDQSNRRASVSFVNDTMHLTSAVLDTLTGSFYSRLTWHRARMVSGR
jgi:Lipocalin-like domain